MKQFLKKIINKKFSFYNNSLYGFHKIFFSQEGEDILLKHLFQYKKNGFYIDVGAHHPQKHSNTYLLYLQGWKGINIEAMPEAIHAFEKIRPNDINLNFAVSEENKEIEFHILNAKEMNTANSNLLNQYLKNPEYYVEKTIKIRSERLEKILDKYLPHNQEIDILSIDVEGLDLEVLKSNNWNKYRPQIILIEEHISSIEQCLNSHISIFLKEKGYSLKMRTFNTSFYQNNN